MKFYYQLPIRRLLLSLFLLFPLSLWAQEADELLAKGLINYQTLFSGTGTEESPCFRIPSLVTAPNGDLIAAIDNRHGSCGDLKWNNNIDIVIRRSQDNGLSWEFMETIVDFPIGQSASDPSMIVDQITGEIFLFYNFMDLENEKDIYYLHVVKSADYGRTWSKPLDITNQITSADWHNNFKFITSGRGIQTKSGILLHTLVNLQSGLHVFGSHDHGQTWFYEPISISPADESKIIELANGNWLINSRVNNGSGMRYMHLSSDLGKSWQSWSEPALTDPGCNASIIRYTSIADGFDRNRLLFANANDAKNRKNLTVKISYDEGKTWSEGKTIYAGSAAYSSLTLLENGDIGLFFEKDDYQENAFVSFSLNWLTDGKDTFRPDNGK